MGLEAISDLTEVYVNYKPAYNNLYTIEIFSSDGTTDTMSNYIKFHATNVTFNGESLNLTRNEVTKLFAVNDSNTYSRTNDLSITWRENADWEVKRYHEDWIALFYDRDNDQYLSTDNPNDRYRKIVVTLPSSYEKTRVLKFTLEDVLPKTMGNLSLGWGPQASIITHSMSYYPTRWYWGNESVEYDTTSSNTSTASDNSTTIARKSGLDSRFSQQSL